MYYNLSMDTAFVTGLLGSAPFLLLGEMAPYLLLGFLVAGILSVAVSPQKVKQHLGGRGLWPVIKATIFGIPLPLCSCGVIPVAASLKRYKASNGATTAFLLSTPQTGVDSIFVTLSLLGPVFAVFRPLAALVSGVLGGTLVDIFDQTEEDQTTEDTVDAQLSGNLSSGGLLYRILHYAFVTLPGDIGRSLLVGLIIAGAISWLIPENFFAEMLGTGIVPKIIMMLAGIPIYVCATASVPVAAALIAKGISPGAALVFLMTGPATNAAAITIIWNLMGKRTTMIYLGTVAVLSLVFGILLDAIFTASGTAVEPGMAWMLPGSVKTAAAVVLLVILLVAIVRPYLKKRGPAAQDEGAITLSVKGMTCDHCANTIRETVSAMPGVESAEVDRTAGIVVLNGNNLDTPSICAAIEDLGYKASAEKG